MVVQMFEIKLNNTIFIDEPLNTSKSDRSIGGVRLLLWIRIEWVKYCYGNIQALIFSENLTTVEIVFHNRLDDIDARFAL